jgi:hypothetical protein
LYNDPNNPNQNPYGNNFNNYNNQYDNNFQTPYDVEYERKIRIETEKLRQLLAEIETKNSAECSLNVAAQWNFETNVNEVTQIEAVSRTLIVSKRTSNIDLQHSFSLTIQSSKSVFSRFFSSCLVWEILIVYLKSLGKITATCLRFFDFCFCFLAQRSATLF